MGNDRQETISQLRVVDRSGVRLPRYPAYPGSMLPSAQYAGGGGALPYAGGTTSPALGAILRGGIGAPHPPMEEEMLLQAMQQYVEGLKK